MREKMCDFTIVQLSPKCWIIAARNHPLDSHVAITKKLRNLDDAEKVFNDLEHTDERFWSELTTESVYVEGTFYVGVCDP